MTHEPDVAPSFSQVVEFFKRWTSKFTRLASVAIYVVYALLWAVHHWIPGLLHEALRLSFSQAFLVSILLGVLGLTLKIEEMVREELVRKRPFQVHRKMEDAFAHVCSLLHSRRAKRIDMLQFSGFTAIPVLKEIAKSCRGAVVRLLLIDREHATAYGKDKPNFHVRRIDGTRTELEVIQEDYADITVGVWSYKTEPAISGIVVDDWLVTAGWYHGFPKSKDSAEIVFLRGHATPAITAVDHEAEPFLSMVRAQSGAVLKTSTLEYSFGPQAKSFHVQIDNH